MNNKQFLKSIRATTNLNELYEKLGEIKQKNKDKDWKDVLLGQLQDSFRRDKNKKKKLRDKIKRLEEALFIYGTYDDQIEFTDDDLSKLDKLETGKII